MKKKIFIFLFIFSLLASNAFAIGFDAFVTADNHLWIWGYNSAGQWSSSFGWYDIPEQDYHGWINAKYITGELYSSSYFDIYIAAADKDGPGGLLGSFHTDSGTFDETGSSQLLTDTVNWEIINYSSAWAYTGPTFNPSLLTGWTTPTSYGTNISNDYWMWHSPVTYISNQAQWIWTNQAFNDNYVLFHARITPTGEVSSPPDGYTPPGGYTQNPGEFGQGGGDSGDTVVPEPASILLLGVGILRLITRNYKINFCGHKT
ncbi:MAG TPA: hypothetical protein PLO85_06600 [Candidatus Omnitrophota bacterium]|nr:hypothetical protein [Candidatus Omnitrophota bacterium]